MTVRERVGDEEYAGVVRAFGVDPGPGGSGGTEPGVAHERLLSTLAGSERGVDATEPDDRPPREQFARAVSTLGYDLRVEDAGESVEVVLGAGECTRRTTVDDVDDPAALAGVVESRLFPGESHTFLALAGEGRRLLLLDRERLARLRRRRGPRVRAFGRPVLAAEHPAGDGRLPEGRSPDGTDAPPVETPDPAGPSVDGSDPTPGEGAAGSRLDGVVETLVGLLR
jgi:hypothetical protein